jgi:hypothetical protein
MCSLVATIRTRKVIPSVISYQHMWHSPLGICGDVDGGPNQLPPCMLFKKKSSHKFGRIISIIYHKNYIIPVDMWSIFDDIDTSNITKIIRNLNKRFESYLLLNHQFQKNAHTTCTRIPLRKRKFQRIYVGTLSRMTRVTRRAEGKKSFSKIIGLFQNNWCSSFVPTQTSIGLSELLKKKSVNICTVNSL